MKLHLIDTSLPNQPLIKKAWNALVASDLEGEDKIFTIRMAEAVYSRCEPDIELAAAILLMRTGPDEETLKALPPRAAGILNMLLGEGGTDGGPYAKELGLLRLAGAAQALRRDIDFVSAALEHPELVVAFGRAADPLASAEEKALGDARGFGRISLAEKKAAVSDLLGKSGEPRLEQYYVDNYDKLARLIGEPPLTPQAPPAPPKPAAKGPELPK